ncbi:MAG: aminotransferase class I/II-fold pyridoxal phosphate-dependent enzyme [Thermoleophilaceae bacterium]
MQVPLFASSLDAYKPRLTEKVAEVIDGGRYILGPEVEAFESEFADYLGVRHCVGVANGTDALAIALRALGVGPGDEVVLPSYTFYATAEATASAGAVPVFCDVDPHTFCVTAETVKAAITPRTRAIIAVHLYGNVAPMAELRELGLPVLEDAAQAAGARLEGAMAGALGDAATFSFFPSKNLPCLGDGGAVVTDDDERGPAGPAAALPRLRRQADLPRGGLQLAPGRDPGGGAARAARRARRLERGAPGRRGGLRAPRAGRARGAAGGGSRAPSTSTTCSWCAMPRADELAARPERGGRRRARLLPGARAPSAGDDGLLRRVARTCRAPRRPPVRGWPCPWAPACPTTPSARWCRRARLGRPDQLPHVLVMRPLIEAMRADGHEVQVTARDFAQTLELCERFGMAHTAVGRHRGGKLASKGLGLASRSAALAALGSPAGASTWPWATAPTT